MLSVGDHAWVINGPHVGSYAIINGIVGVFAHVTIGHGEYVIPIAYLEKIER